MLRKPYHTVFALALGMAAATGYGLADGPTNQVVVQGSGAHQSMRAKSILGSTVTLQGGANAGTVHDIIFNDEGVVDYLVVSEGGKLVTVPWDAVKFNYEKRTAVINIQQDQFRQVPTYTSERYPDFYAPEYRTQVNRYYGILPGRERRIERREERRP